MLNGRNYNEKLEVRGWRNERLYQRGCEGLISNFRLLRANSPLSTECMCVLMGNNDLMIKCVNLY